VCARVTVDSEGADGQSARERVTVPERWCRGKRARLSRTRSGGGRAEVRRRAGMLLLLLETTGRSRLPFTSRGYQRMEKDNKEIRAGERRGGEAEGVGVRGRVVVVL
jgi:hypothetical protein